MGSSFVQVDRTASRDLAFQSGEIDMVYGKQDQTWAERIAESFTPDEDVYVYFNNDSGGHAHRDAIELRTLLNARNR